MKNILVGTICLIIGFLSGAYVYKHNTPKLPPSQPQTKINKEKFQSLLDHEMQSFAMAQDAETKLIIAEELYGKVVVLFMAELGLRAAKPVLVSDSAGVNGLPEVSVPNVADEKEVEKKEVEKIEVEKEEVALAAVEEEAKPQVMPKLGTQEHFLRSSLVAKFDDNSGRMIGKFQGSLTHKVLPNKGRVDRVVLDIDLYHSGEMITGDTLVSLIDPNGKEYARNSGAGANKILKEAFDKKNAFYVEVSPKSYLLLNLNEYPKVLGEYYQKGTFIGTVTLRKD